MTQAGIVFGVNLNAANRLERVGARVVEDEQATDETAAAPPGLGEVLRMAREASGLSLAQVAEHTRITLRHLKMIEAGDFAQLPGRSHAIGFSRSFAKAVGLDDGEIAERVREELALIDPQGAGLAQRSFEPGDPARVPSSGLAWFSAFAALVLLVGGSLFVWNSYIAPGATLPWLTSDEEAPAPQVAQTGAAPAAAPVPEGQVVFTASEQVWVRFYEQGGRVLLEKEMLPGESYALPEDAEQPMLTTARPDLLSIAVGGRQVPPLAEVQDMIDAPVAAEALLARGSEPQAVASPTT